MARVTVEDCIEKVPNRFNLVMMAAQRARDISAGMPLTVDRDNDRNPVVSLREIAEETIDLVALEENLIKGLQRHVEFDEPEEEEMDLLAFQQNIESGGVPAGTTEPDDEVNYDDVDNGKMTDAVVREFRGGGDGSKGGEEGV